MFSGYLPTYLFFFCIGTGRRRHTLVIIVLFLVLLLLSGVFFPPKSRDYVFLFAPPITKRISIGRSVAKTILNVAFTIQYDGTVCEIRVKQVFNKGKNLFLYFDSDFFTVL